MFFLIAILTAILLSVIIVLAVGIDVRIAVNIDNDFAVANIFILKYLFIFKVKLLLHDEDIYVKLGNKPYRKMTYFIKNKKKHRKSQLEFPSLTISKMSVNVSVGVDDNAFADTLLWGGLELLLNNVQRLASNYCKIKKYNNTISPSYTDDSAKLDMNINIKFSILKLCSFLLFKSNGKDEIVKND